MSIGPVRPSSTFTADLTGAPSGLGTSLTFGIRRAPDGTMVDAFATAGIVETALGGGVSNYTATRTAPATVSDLDADGPRYQAIWRISGVEQAPEDLWVSGAVPEGDLVPGLEEVGTLLFARTKGANMEYLGTFTNETRPTATVVEGHIAAAVETVRRRVGYALDTTEDQSLIASARHAAAIRAAMDAERAMRPEQAMEADSVYALLRQDWEEEIAALMASVTTDPGDTQGIGSVGVMSPTRGTAGSLPVLDQWPGWWPGGWW